MASQSLNMTTGSPVKLILAFSLPLMVGNVLQQLYSVVDTAIVGQGVGISALASLGASDWIYWFILWMLQGLTLGFSILISHRFGANDAEGIKKTLFNIIFLCVVFTIFFTLIAELTISPVLHLLNTPESIFDGTKTYLMIIFGGIGITMAYNMASCILRAVGDSRSPTMAIVIASVINIALDLLFVLVFQWGIAGAAWATVLAQLFSFLYCLKRMKRFSVLRLTPDSYVVNWQLCKDLLAQGVPNALSMAVIAIGGMIVQWAVNTNGQYFVAGFTATNKLYGVLEGVSFAYAAAISVYMGQNFGANKMHRLRSGMNQNLPLFIITPLLIGFSMIFVGRFLLRFFIDTHSAGAQEVEDIAFHYMMVMSAFLWVLYPVNIYRAALQGLGESTLASYSGILELLARGFVVLVCVPFISQESIYYAEMAAWVVAGSYLIFCFYWKLRKLEKS